MLPCLPQSVSSGRQRKSIAIAVLCSLLSQNGIHTFGTANFRVRPQRPEREWVLFGTANQDGDRPQRTRFASPLLEFGYPPAAEEYEKGRTGEKPLLLYLPGFDGTYLSAFFQYPELHSLFEVRCLVSAMDDRSTYDELKNTIIDFLRRETLPTNDTVTKVVEETAPSKTGEGLLAQLLNGVGLLGKQSTTTTNTKTQSRPVYLVGESFGGILALEVALTLQNDNANSVNLQGLTLINAATCYDRSRLAAEGPPLAQTSPLFYIFGILHLLPMFLDRISARQFLAIVQSQALPSLIDDEMREAYMGRLAFALPTLVKFMPQNTFHWRLTEWLEVGCRRMADTMSSSDQNRKLDLRTLIIAGENDRTLPSIAEAERLAQLLPNCRVHVVPQVGHANTAGTCLDLAAELRGWFPELAAAGGRTVMKPAAAAGRGVLFGMEPRYDDGFIGLNPLRYWSKSNYHKVDGHSPS